MTRCGWSRGFNGETTVRIFHIDRHGKNKASKGTLVKWRCRVKYLTIQGTVATLQNHGFTPYPSLSSVAFLAASHEHKHVRLKGDLVIPTHSNAGFIEL